MIKSYKSKNLEKFFKEGKTKGIPKELEQKIRIRLEVLDSALIVKDIDLPGYNLHELKGDRQDTWSIKISKNWRITFTFENGNVYDVDMEDYH